MFIILPVILFVIFFAVLACLFKEGMWGNAIQFINVVTAALLATNFFEPTADLLEDWFDWCRSASCLLDFLILWMYFALFLIIFRLFTDKISKVKVRFLKIADQIGSVLFACLVGWIFVCFTLFSMHTAPLSEKFLFGSFDAEKERMILGIASPDQAWITFTRLLSRNAYSWGEENQFDRYGNFRVDYADRRATLEEYVNKHEALLLDEQHIIRPKDDEELADTPADPPADTPEKPPAE